MQNMLRTTTIIFCSFLPAFAGGVEYDCLVKKKLDSERTYNQEYITQYKFSVKVEENNSGTFISRCSFSIIESKATCDRYEVDKVAFDENVKIKKYYVFRSQFDVQLFPDLSFLENNGRAGIAFGKCKVVIP